MIAAVIAATLMRTMTMTMTLVGGVTVPVTRRITMPTSVTLGSFRKIVLFFGSPRLRRAVLLVLNNKNQFLF